MSPSFTHFSLVALLFAVALPSSVATAAEAPSTGCVAAAAENDTPGLGAACAKVLNDPNSALESRLEALVLRSIWHMRARRDAEAVADIDMGLRLAPAHAKLLQLRAMLYFDEGQVDKAEAMAKQSANADPTRAMTFELLGRIALSKGDQRSALGYFNTAIELAPNQPYPRYRRAELLLALARPAEALQDTEWLIAQAPQLLDHAGEAWIDGHDVKLSLASRIQQANALRALDRYDAAEQYLGKILADERTSFTLTQRSQFLQGLPIGAGMQSRLDEALADAEEAVRLDPQDARAHRQYATTLEYARRPAEALASIDLALQLERHERGFAPLLWSRARVLRALGRKDEAVEAARTSLLTAQAYDPSYLMRRIRRLEQLGYWSPPKSDSQATDALDVAIAACMEDQSCW